MRLTRRTFVRAASGVALSAVSGYGGSLHHGAAEPVGAGVVRRAVSFPSDGEMLHGWLYSPRGAPSGTPQPGIVTANALTSVKEINLPDYAASFAAAGYVTLVFDYRYWGASSGSPRFHVAPVEHRRHPPRPDVPLRPAIRLPSSPGGIRDLDGGRSHALPGHLGTTPASGGGGLHRNRSAATRSSALGSRGQGAVRPADGRSAGRTTGPRRHAPDRAPGMVPATGPRVRAPCQGSLRLLPPRQAHVRSRI